MITLLYIWFAALIYMGVYFIKCTFSHVSLFLYIYIAWCCVVLVIFQLYSGSPQPLCQDLYQYFLVGLINIYWSNQGKNIIHNSICIIFLHKGRDHSKSTISVFKAIFGYIKHFPKCGFWWYQGSLVDLFLIHVL